MSGSEFWNYTADNMADVTHAFLRDPSRSTPRSQDLSISSPAPRISKLQLKTLSRVCPHVQTADQIFNISRCLDLYNLSIVVSWQGKTLKLLSITPINDPHLRELARTRLRSGQFVMWDGVIVVKCADDTVLGVSRMVLPFKPIISAAQFYRDHCSGRVEKVFRMEYSSSELDSLGFPQKVQTCR